MDDLSFKTALMKYGLCDHYEFHELFVEEFIASVSKSGEERIIVNQFFRRLAIIINLDNLNCGLPWLEPLKNCDLYSLHIDTKSKNYRMLFSVQPNGKLFLRMFDEKSRKGKASYSPNIKIALSRK